jgi:hypothetical protein
VSWEAIRWSQDNGHHPGKLRIGSQSIDQGEGSDRRQLGSGNDNYRSKSLGQQQGVQSIRRVLPGALPPVIERRPGITQSALLNAKACEQHIAGRDSRARLRTGGARLTGRKPPTRSPDFHRFE